MNPVDTLETAKATNPLTQLQNFGQSIWLDYIRRDLFSSGQLQRLITEDGPARHDVQPGDFRESHCAGATLCEHFREPRGPRELDAVSAATTLRPSAMSGRGR